MKLRTIASMLFHHQRIFDGCLNLIAWVQSQSSLLPLKDWYCMQAKFSGLLAEVKFSFGGETSWDGECKRWDEFAG